MIHLFTFQEVDEVQTIWSKGKLKSDNKVRVQAKHWQEFIIYDNHFGRKGKKNNPKKRFSINCSCLFC